MEEGNRIDFTKYSEKLPSCKILKKLIPHSKISLDSSNRFQDKNSSVSYRNTPEKVISNFTKTDLTEKKKERDDSSRENNHFREILGKYSNIYRKNVEIDLRSCGNHNKYQEKEKNNSKNKIMMKKNNFDDKNDKDKFIEKISEKMKKINTAKINLQEDDDIPCEARENDSKPLLLIQSPVFFAKKHSFGSTNDYFALREKLNKSFAENGNNLKSKVMTPMRESI